MRALLRKLIGFARRPRWRSPTPTPTPLPTPAPPSVPAPAQGNLARQPDADRRRWPRLQLQLEVRLRFSSTEAMVRCCTFDISRGGAFIVLENPRPEGTAVRLTITVGERQVVLGGIVVRASRGDDEPRGMGILFTEVSADDEAYLASLGE